MREQLLKSSLSNESEGLREQIACLERRCQLAEGDAASKARELAAVHQTASDEGRQRAQHAEAVA